jgi:hypothetical protein
MEVPMDEIEDVETLNDFEQELDGAMRELREALAEGSRLEAIGGLAQVFFAESETSRAHLSVLCAVAFGKLADARSEVEHLGTALEAAKNDLEALRRDRDDARRARAEIAAEGGRLAAQVARVRKAGKAWLDDSYPATSAVESALIDAIEALDGDPS